MAEPSEPGEPSLRKSTGEMHPAPSLEEAPPVNLPRLRLGYDLQALVSDIRSPGTASSSTGFENQDPENRSVYDLSGPGHLLPRPDPTTTTTTRLTNNRLSSLEVATSSSAVDDSRPMLNCQSVAAILDEPDEPNEHHAPKSARRRTGPLNREQRVKAAIIRKIGACQDCRRRRVSCDPSHHGETWDSAILKYGFDVPGIELLPGFDSRDAICSSHSATASRKRGSDASDLVSPSASAGLYHRYRGVDLESTMDHTGHRRLSPDTSLESSPTSPKSSATQPPQKKRKPLPGAPRDRSLHSIAPAALVLPAVKPKRYTAVRYLQLQWASDFHQDGSQAGLDLGNTLRGVYGFSHQSNRLPHRDSHKHLTDVIHRFVDNEDDRDVLKIIYYAGGSYLDGDRNMMLAAPGISNPACDIRWNSIQTQLQETVSDVFVIMDCPFWTSPTFKRRGILEILAVNNLEGCEDNPIPTGLLTEALTKRLGNQAGQARKGPLHVTDLYNHLLAECLNSTSEKEVNVRKIRSFPAPFHMLVAGDSTPRSSIQLPAPQRSQLQPSGQREGRRAAPEVITLHFDGMLDEDRESLNEWLRIRPETVQIKTEGGDKAPEGAGSSSGIPARPEKVQVKTEGEGTGTSSGLLPRPH